LKRLALAAVGLALVASTTTSCRSSGYSQAEVEGTVAAAQTASAPTALGVTPSPLPNNSPAPDFRAFANDWWHHGFGMTVTADGEAIASWRVYRWCDQDPTPPCDADTPQGIVNGGRATIIFGDVDGATAYGWVKETTDEDTFYLGAPVSLTLLPYGLALLRHSLQTPSSVPTILCGPDAEMPGWLEDTRPCGA